MIILKMITPHLDRLYLIYDAGDNRLKWINDDYYDTYHTDEGYNDNDNDIMIICWNEVMIIMIIILPKACWEKSGFWQSVLPNLFMWTQ